MELTPMQKATGSFKALGRGELLSLAHAYLESHMLACELVGQEKPDHASQAEISDRVARLTDAQLMALLMPVAALSQDG